jgi:hypothetical protein
VVRRWIERRHGLLHREQAGLVDVVAVDLFDRDLGDCDGEGLGVDLAGEALARSAAEPLRVVETRQMRPLGQDHGRRHDRAGERTDAHLVDARNPARTGGNETPAQAQQAREAARLALHLDCAAAAAPGERSGTRAPVARQAMRGSAQRTCRGERRDARAQRGERLAPSAHSRSPASPPRSPTFFSSARTRFASSGSRASQATERCHARSGCAGKPQTRPRAGTSSITPARAAT